MCNGEKSHLVVHQKAGEKGQGKTYADSSLRVLAYLVNVGSRGYIDTFSNTWCCGEVKYKQEHSYNLGTLQSVLPNIREINPHYQHVN